MLARLAGSQKSPNYLTSSFLYNLEIELTYEYCSILKNEQDFWMLKFIIN